MPHTSLSLCMLQDRLCMPFYVPSMSFSSRKSFHFCPMRSYPCLSVFHRYAWHLSLQWTICSVSQLSHKCHNPPSSKTSRCQCGLCPTLHNASHGWWLQILTVVCLESWNIGQEFVSPFHFIDIRDKGEPFWFHLLPEVHYLSPLHIFPSGFLSASQQ